MAAHQSLNGGQFRHVGNGNSGDWYEYTKIGSDSRARVHLTLATNQMPARTVYATPSDRSTISDTDWSHLTGAPLGTPAPPGTPGPTNSDPDYHGHVSAPVHKMEEAKRDLDTPGLGGQPKLFGMATTPGRSTVSVMIGTREGRVHAGTMLGIAQMQNIRDYGRSLLPSGDLSPHSAKLAKHLHQLGATSEVPAEASNHLDFGMYAPTYKGKGNDRLSAQEVSAGRNHMRRVVRGGNADPRGVSDADGPPKEPIPNHNRKSPPRRGTVARRPDPNQGTLF
jgi:hypothetical protein